MMGDSKIEWTEETWNPLRGCSRVSAGCDHCYAEGIAARFSGPGRPFEGVAKMVHGKPHWTGKIKLVPDKLSEPLGRRKPTTYFVNSMSDLFHEGVPDEFIDRVFAVMALCPQHTFQILTKRPERMAEYLGMPAREALIGQVVYRMSRPAKEVILEWSGLPLPNVWLGVSVEDQATADERIPHLLSTPAAVRFVSYEPALGPVDFTEWLHDSDCEGSASTAKRLPEWECTCCDPPEIRLDWVICGGESGPGARPMHPDWPRSVRDQCLAAGVPFFFKQWGAYGPEQSKPVVYTDVYQGGVSMDSPCPMYRVGKKAAGRLLDGEEHDERPPLAHEGNG